MEFSFQVFWDALISKEFFDGAVLAIALAVCAQIIACVLGFLIAVARSGKSKPLIVVSAGYTWFFRAVPTLLILLICWNVLPQLIPAMRQTWYSPFLAGLIGFSLVQASYMAEILRSALSSIEEGQHQAARALGMSPALVMRKVLLPQMIRVAIPPAGNEFISMIKYTSLASVISLMELLATAQARVATTFSYAEYYCAVLVYYLVIVSALMIVQARIEKRYEWKSAKMVKTRRPLRSPALVR